MLDRVQFHLCSRCSDRAHLVAHVVVRSQDFSPTRRNQLGEEVINGAPSRMKGSPMRCPERKRRHMSIPSAEQTAKGQALPGGDIHRVVSVFNCRESARRVSSLCDVRWETNSTDAVPESREISSRAAIGISSGSETRKATNADVDLSPN